MNLKKAAKRKAFGVVYVTIGRSQIRHIANKRIYKRCDIQRHPTTPTTLQRHILTNRLPAEES